MYGPEYVKPETLVFLVPTPPRKFVPIKKDEFLGWLRAMLTSMGLQASDYAFTVSVTEPCKRLSSTKRTAPLLS